MLIGTWVKGLRQENHGDVRRLDGSWMIVETGDAGVSGLPAVIEPGDFYAALMVAVVSGR